MDGDTGIRVRRVPEDAAEGSILVVPEPTKPWVCSEDQQLNDSSRRNCVYCGRWREDVEL